MAISYEERATVRREMLRADLVNMAGHLVDGLADDAIRINRHDIVSMRADILERILEAAMNYHSAVHYPSK